MFDLVPIKVQLSVEMTLEKEKADNTEEIKMI